MIGKAKPKISVVMGVWNDGEYLPFAIESILTQTFSDFELIIINDGSTDNSAQTTREYSAKDPRSVVVENENKTGLTHALNQGMEIAQGKYIARLDADDVALPERLQVQADYLEKHPEVFLCGTKVEMIDQQGETVSADEGSALAPEEVAEILPKRNCLVHSSIMFRNENVRYREKFYYSQDYDLYLLLLSQGKKIANLPQTLVKWRMSSEGRTYLKRDKQRKFVETAQKFYWQRISGGEDGYEEFDEKEILEAEDTKNVEALLLEDEMSQLLKKSDFQKARKIFHEKYAKMRDVGFFKKKSVFWFFVTFPTAYRLYRRILYGKNIAKKENCMALFMTPGMSLAKWSEVGSLKREVAPYNYLAKYFEKIYIVSYGNSDQRYFKNQLADDVVVLDKESKANNFFYQFLIPFKFHLELGNCKILKTNQLYASVPAMISKLFSWKSRLVVRSGYIASLNAKLYGSGWLWRTYTNFLEWLAYRVCDKALIAGDGNKEWLIKKYPFLNGKIESLNNGIDTEIFKPKEIEKKYDIGYVGRLQKDKNLLNLLRACVGKDWKICLIGQGEQEEELLDFAKDNKVDLKLIDRVDNFELPGYYNSFRVFAFPSLHEGNPKTLLEAMACGLPVVGCDVVGVKELIENEENGALVGVAVKEIEKGIALLLNDGELQSRLSMNARKFILENYDMEKILKKEREIYEAMD